MVIPEAFCLPCPPCQHTHPCLNVQAGISAPLALWGSCGVGKSWCTDPAKVCLTAITQHPGWHQECLLPSWAPLWLQVPMWKLTDRACHGANLITHGQGAAAHVWVDNEVLDGLGAHAQQGQAWQEEASGVASV